jgi:hypothetical protein
VPSSTIVGFRKGAITPSIRCFVDLSAALPPEAYTTIDDATSEIAQVDNLIPVNPQKLHI